MDAPRLPAPPAPLSPSLDVFRSVAQAATAAARPVLSLYAALASELRRNIPDERLLAAALSDLERSEMFALRGLTTVAGADG